MKKADAALHADIESDGTDAERRIELIDELQLAADGYSEKIGGLAFTCRRNSTEFGKGT